VKSLATSGRWRLLQLLEKFCEIFAEVPKNGATGCTGHWKLIAFHDGWSGKNRSMGKFPSACSQSFVTEKNFPVSADLDANINEALKESRYLIVICSPGSAQSR
jgi:hypothetical protein